MPRLRTLFSLAACVLLAACDPPNTISPQRSERVDAPTQVRVDGYDLTLETYVWRDFQPISPPDGKPMIAVLHVRTTDGRPFPAGVTADQVTVVFGEQTWTAPVRVEHPSARPSALALVARDGPRWGPHVNVNVVVRLRDSNGGEHWLGAVNQPIHRTD
jgi:hypothetical protein